LKHSNLGACYDPLCLAISFLSLFQLSLHFLGFCYLGCLCCQLVVIVIEDLANLLAIHNTSEKALFQGLIIEEETTTTE